uniref:Uncharacterized protein n=1 Tax=Eutreptiella gymnastica TaxID=73025 RepID=A0A7S4FX43_9EUGL
MPLRKAHDSPPAPQKQHHRHVTQGKALTSQTMQLQNGWRSGGGEREAVGDGALSPKGTGIHHHRQAQAWARAPWCPPSPLRHRPNDLQITSSGACGLRGPPGGQVLRAGEIGLGLSGGLPTAHSVRQCEGV